MFTLEISKWNTLTQASQKYTSQPKFLLCGPITSPQVWDHRSLKADRLECPSLIKFSSHKSGRVPQEVFLAEPEKVTDLFKDKNLQKTFQDTNYDGGGGENTMKEHRTLHTHWLWRLHLLWVSDSSPSKGTDAPTTVSGLISNKRMPLKCYKCLLKNLHFNFACLPFLIQISSWEH